MTKDTAENSVMQAFVDLMKKNFAKIGKELIVSETEEEKKKEKKTQSDSKKKEQKENKAPKVATKRAYHEPVRRS